MPEGVEIVAWFVSEKIFLPALANASSAATLQNVGCSINGSSSPSSFSFSMTLNWAFLMDGNMYGSPFSSRTVPSPRFNLLGLSSSWNALFKVAITTGVACVVNDDLGECTAHLNRENENTDDDDMSTFGCYLSLIFLNIFEISMLTLPMTILTDEKEKTYD